MARKVPSRRLLRSLCAEVHPDDGVDPRLSPKGGRRRRGDRKAHQLCGLVAETLSYALGQDGDEVLQGLLVASVEPAPDASRLLVTVGPLSPEGPDPGEVLEHLDRASGRLRSAVAAAITRRKAPILAYRYAVPAGMRRPAEGLSFGGEWRPPRPPLHPRKVRPSDPRARWAAYRTSKATSSRRALPECSSGSGSGCSCPSASSAQTSKRYLPGGSGPNHACQ
jgi:ribosome-binding factor A